MSERFTNIGRDRVIATRVAARGVTTVDEHDARERRHPHAAVRDRNAGRRVVNIDREQGPDDLDRRAGCLDPETAPVATLELSEQPATAERDRRHLIGRGDVVEPRGADERGARVTEPQRQRRIGRRDEAVGRAATVGDHQHQRGGERECTRTAGEQPAPGRMNGLVEPIFDARPDLRAPDIVELVTGGERDAHQLVAAIRGGRGIAQGVGEQVVAAHDILASRDARP
jgi:hypothetical protein